MEESQRLHLTAQSAVSRNKKLAAILDNRTTFMEKIDKAQKEINSKQTSNKENEAALLEGRDITVCVRIRPLLDYEEKAGFFKAIFSQQPQVQVAEPKFTVKNDAKIIQSTFNVDFAFGPEHCTEEIYECVAEPVISMGLQGGVSTIFAYGQTASGKTFTISTILQHMARELIAKKEEHLQLYLSVFEILGNAARDLLNNDDCDNNVDIKEDKFGHVNVINSTEIHISCLEELLQKLDEAMSHRKTATTFKNDSSSRSHAVCQIRVKNLKHRTMEDGKIFVIDLAGSENAADSQFHDKSRVKETQAINKSLMALKDCIRNRALSALNPDKYYHVPYRLSKLTLLLKDAFEVESRKLCKTVVIANVAPSVADVAMSLNTLRYVTPLKIGQSNREKKLANPENPMNWDNARLRQWIGTKASDAFDVDLFCPYESGMQILRIPEATFIERVLTACPSWSEKRAVAFYKSLWLRLIDARTKDRKEKLKLKNGTLKQRVDEHYVRIAETGSKTK